MRQANLTAIGHIETPYHSLDDCPRNIQTDGGPACQLILNRDLSEALTGLIAGQRILVLYWFERSNRQVLQQKSRRTGELAGVFSLRSPNRPNPIGAAVLPIEQIDGHIITVRGLDCLDGTALLDIKPAMAGE